MRKIFLLLLATVFIVSCQKEKRGADSMSNIKTNAILIIMENQLWNGEVGDSLRNKFASPVDGLPQEEPIFSISQSNPRFLEDLSESRNIIFIEKWEYSSFEIKKNIYTNPKNLVYIKGKNVIEIVGLIEQHFKQIINTFKETEIAETQYRIAQSVMGDSSIQAKFDISLSIPSAYISVVEKENFLWIRKEMPSGSNNILIYEVPLYSVDTEENDITANIIKIRDSIGEKHIKGMQPEAFMTTESSYAPYLFNVIIDEKKTYETKGTWEMKNDFMSGPFINYAIRDEINNRYLIIEGFCYNPSTSKRDLMHELESIIKTVTFL
ncbi:MAG TPA: DUF4837 family protein [Flavobacterium sp.]|nr:DUF4837 family protein [Flavobacterium sp.]